MSLPLVSVIIPTYNSAHFLPDAVASVRAQKGARVEIVIVDDGSTDQTVEVLAELGPDIVYIRRENGGPAAARNTGLRAARGAWIAFLDADDVWPEDKLEFQLERLLQDDTLDLVSGKTRYVALPGCLPSQIPPAVREPVSHIHLAAALFRRSAFERIGFFDEGLRMGEDADWFLRAREAGLKILILPKVTLDYRHHTTNMTRSASLKDLQLFGVLRRSMIRRRAAEKPVELPSWSSFLEEESKSD
jgi:glycosyltransferase involved in cell wall biosynthesis